ncbi:hypothetical protein BJY01DRAFT_142590 [Aspergillus pseudoustus]|uniref:Secreted protein n=1 Tax=Aspergillus pseudoustus TaxID=1810923 RepID=A0ABR4KBC3_9EURO
MMPEAWACVAFAPPASFAQHLQLSIIVEAIYTRPLQTVYFFNLSDFKIPMLIHKVPSSFTASQGPTTLSESIVSKTVAKRDPCRKDPLSETAPSS